MKTENNINACGGCGGKKKKKGFTLIELLIVITIIGILAVALLPRVMGAPAKARDVDRKVDLNLLATALESYAADNGSYPASTGLCTDTGLTALDRPLYTYLAGDVIADPISTNGVDYDDDGTINCLGSYFYRSLTANGVANTAYVLLAQTEADGKTTGYIDNRDFTLADVDSKEKVVALSVSILTGLDNVYMLVH